MSESFAENLAAGRDGDAAAQGKLLQPFEPWLRLLARMQLDHRLRAKCDPSDLVQQTLLEACRGFAQFRGGTEAELAGWLRGILAHALAHTLRRFEGTQGRDLGRELDLSSQKLQALAVAPDTSPSDRAGRNEQELRLAEVLAKLPEDYREVLVLRHLEGLPHGEIAERMGRSAGAVRALWVRALAAMRDQMQPQAPG